jgi:hypothetical protein
MLLQQRVSMLASAADAEHCREYAMFQTVACSVSRWSGYVLDFLTTIQTSASSVSSSVIVTLSALFLSLRVIYGKGNCKDGSCYCFSTLQEQERTAFTKILNDHLHSGHLPSYRSAT